MLPIVAAFVGGLASSGVGAALKATGVQSFLDEMIDPKIVYPKSEANGTSYAEYTLLSHNFKFIILAPSNEDIMSIDNFFESYGYRVNKFEVPNLKVRGNFTYIKTRDAQISSSVRQAAEQMAAMLNAGYKFWVTEIGQ